MARSTAQIRAAEGFAQEVKAIAIKMCGLSAQAGRLRPLFACNTED